jgi:hypothetical protein
MDDPLIDGYETYCIGKMNAYCKELEGKLQIAIEALEFYAEPNNWLSREIWEAGEGPALRDDYSTVTHQYNGEFFSSVVGGRKAREVLEEL